MRLKPGAFSFVRARLELQGALRRRTPHTDREKWGGQYTRGGAFEWVGVAEGGSLSGRGLSRAGLELALEAEVQRVLQVTEVIS